MVGDDKPIRFGRSRSILHWIIAIGIALLLASGLLGLSRMAEADPVKVDVLRIHILVGLATLTAIILYLVAAIATKRPRKLSSGNRLLDGLAIVVHILLALIALTVIASGVATVKGAELGEIVFGRKADHLPGFVHSLASFHVHAWMARALLVLVVLHILGALYHHFILRDGVFRRMAVRGRD